MIVGSFRNRSSLYNNSHKKSKNRKRKYLALKPISLEAKRGLHASKNIRIKE